LAFNQSFFAIVAAGAVAIVSMHPGSYVVVVVIIIIDEGSLGSLVGTMVADVPAVVAVMNRHSHGYLVRLADWRRQGRRG
jgi:hypothetical protein